MFVLFLGWGIYFIYVLFKFRSSNNSKANYEGVTSHYSTYIEGGVILFEAFLIFALALPKWQDLKMNIEKGQFLDIEPKAGRLFGLLSIQALPRRLSLDFTDFFSEGFAFDSIKGDFNLENGEAYTNNLQMIGPSGDIMINGRTGLVAEDYDQIATVVPKVSDSLPVASALFGPVGVGVGAVLYFAGELFESIPTNIDKILSQQYSIKGNWENPEINKISLE